MFDRGYNTRYAYQLIEFLGSSEKLYSVQPAVPYDTGIPLPSPGRSVQFWCQMIN